MIAFFFWRLVYFIARIKQRVISFGNELTVFSRPLFFFGIYLPANLFFPFKWTASVFWSTFGVRILDFLIWKIRPWTRSGVIKIWFSIVLCDVIIMNVVKQNFLASGSFGFWIAFRGLAPIIWLLAMYLLHFLFFIMVVVLIFFLTRACNNHIGGFTIGPKCRQVYWCVSLVSWLSLYWWHRFCGVSL